jgi:hypothetical protein
MLPQTLVTLAVAALAAASADTSSDAHRFLQVRAAKQHRSPLWKRAMGPAWTSKPVLKTSKFTTGVAAMQLSKRVWTPAKH